VMRVRADGAKNFGKALGDGEHLVMAADTGRNRDKPLQAGCFGAGHNGVELASKVVKVQVAMAVNEHGVGYRWSPWVFALALRPGCVAGRSASRSGGLWLECL